MQLSGKVVGTNLEVTIPPIRTDILHPCDILEDIAIGYGYNKILHTSQPPKTLCHGVQQPLNKFSDKLRGLLAMAGYLEVLTFSLCSTAENYELLRLPNDGQAVVLSNPQSQNFQVVRTTLYPGLLKTLKSSTHMHLPIKIFEISDVCLLDQTVDVGASNKRCLCAIDLSSGSHQFEEIHGLLDRVMIGCGIPFKGSTKEKNQPSYYIKPTQSPMYLENRCAEVLIHRPDKEFSIGVFGILRPDVLANFEVKKALAGAIHLDVEALLSTREFLS